MNYAFSDYFEFSHNGFGDVALHPPSIVETTSMSPHDASFLSVPTGTYRFLATTTSGGVDFNRSGGLSATSVRGGPTVADSSCAPGKVLQQDLSITTYGRTDPITTPALTPALARLGSRNFAFYASDSSHIKYTWTDINGPTGAGSCLNDGSNVGACENYTSHAVMDAIPTPPAAVTGLAATRWGNEVVLAYTMSNGSLAVQHSASPETGTWSAPVVIATGIAVDTEVELAPMFTSTSFFPADVVLGAFFVRGGVFDWKFTVDLATWSTRPMLLPGGTLIAGGIPPAIASMPNTYPSPGTTNAADKTCGIFPDTTNKVRFLCYDKNNDVWNDISTALRAMSNPLIVNARKPTLIYHTLRVGADLRAMSQDVGPLSGDPSLGQFFLALHEPGFRPVYYISENVSRTLPPTASTRWQYVGFLGSAWDQSLLTPSGSAAAGMAMFEDSQTSSVRGLAWQLNIDGQQNQVVHLASLPFIDGGFNITLHDGYDFEVMEAGVCRFLRDMVGDAGTRCGYVSPFGY